MAITKVWLDESENECISCGVCESLAPDVFEVPQKMAVKDAADLSGEDGIRDAASSCPVSVIAFAVDGSDERSN